MCALIFDGYNIRGYKTKSLIHEAINETKMFPFRFPLTKWYGFAVIIIFRLFKIDIPTNLMYVCCV